ncbi:MAG TPA: hypothetical protein VLE49_15555 [Anaerolineales bacterium]|nr:hypothetical protein [Anaerolineales bacterium]
MKKLSAFVLVMLLAACTLSSVTGTPATLTSMAGHPSANTSPPPQITPIPTATGILSIDTLATAEATPTPLPRLEGGSPVALATIHMVDPDIGWGIEKGGHIVRTRDGGNTWQDVTPPRGLYNDSGFFALDADTAWATQKPSDVCEDGRITWSDYQACMPGPDAVIWRTVDGGQSWQASEPYKAEDLHYKPIAIQFTDASTGWFLYVSSFGPMGSTTMGMAKTADGGISWVPAVAPQSMCIHRSMAFINAHDGWSGADCRFTPTVGWPLQDFINGKSASGLGPLAPVPSRTTDGSQSWDDSALPSPRVFPAELTSPNADPNISILCGTTNMERISSEAITLQWTCSPREGTPPFTDFNYQYFTSDGGQSWHSWLSTGNEFFLNTQIGWRLYSLGANQVSQLQQTADSGQTWTTIKTAAWQSAHFDFVSERIGWAIVASGDDVTFVHTSDGGQSWSELKPKTVMAISPENASQIAKLAIWPANLINILAFSPDWKTMVSQTGDYSGLRLWDTGSRQIYLFIPFRSGDCGLRDMGSAIFSPDGTLLAAGLCNATVHIWRVADGTLVQKMEGELPDGAAFSPDGSMLATISYQAVVLWRVSDGTQLQTFPADVTDSVAFSPDGTTLALGSRQGLQLWRVSDGALLQTLTAEDMGYCTMAFSRDGTLLASAAERSGLQLWRVADGTLLKTFDDSAYTFMGHKVVFSPDGRLLVSARYGDDGATIHLWQVPSGKLLRTVTGAGTPLSFSPDGSQLVVGSGNVLQVWGISAGPAK